MAGGGAAPLSLLGSSSSPSPQLANLGTSERRPGSLNRRVSMVPEDARRAGKGDRGRQQGALAHAAPPPLASTPESSAGSCPGALDAHFLRLPPHPEPAQPRPGRAPAISAQALSPALGPGSTPA